MATSSTTGKCLIHNDLVASPATDKVGLDSQNSTDADCSQVETSYPYGPEELANRGKMVYEKRLFYPMHVGDVFLGRYLVLDKLGFGISSTVWMVRDVHKQQYFALKAISTECIGSSEYKVLGRLDESAPEHPGWECTSQLVDMFCVPSPLGKKYGTHTFLVFNVMAETLHSFAKNFTNNSIPSQIMKVFLKQILLALDHAHNAGVVHADIKSDNIMIRMPDQDAIGQKLYNVSNDPSGTNSSHQPDKGNIISREREKYSIDYEAMQRKNTWEFPSRSMSELYLNSDPTEEELLGLNVTLCDWGLARFTDKKHIDAVAPPKFKSPELLIGAPWDEKTDIWTLGTQLVRLMTGRDAFSAEDDHGSYSNLQHFFEIELNFGSFPRSLLDNGHSGFINGHFNYGGRVQLQPDLIRVPRLENWFKNFDDEDDKKEFIHLLRHMMRINPEERSSAAELLREPWLRDVVLDHEILATAVKKPVESSDACQKRVDSVIDADSVRDSDSENDADSVRDSDSVHDLNLEKEDLEMDSALEASVPSCPTSSKLSEAGANLTKPSTTFKAETLVEPSTPLEDEKTTPETALLLIGAAVMVACPVESLVLVGLALAVRTFFKTLIGI